MQPEEQHGFRQGGQIEEDFLTANVCLQKLWPQVHPLWTISLDLSKQFTKLLGMHHGLRWDNMESRSTWFGYCNVCTMVRQELSENVMLTALELIFVVVYVGWLECTGCTICEQYSVKHCSVRCLEMHYNLARYAATLPPDRWLPRILTWTCRGQTSHSWSSTKHLGHYAPELLHLSAFGHFEGRGKWCQPVVISDANIRILLHPFMNKTIWRALMCTKCFCFHLCPSRGLVSASGDGYFFYLLSYRRGAVLKHGRSFGMLPTI